VKKTVTIIILDDDHRGKFGFADTDFTIQESVGHLEATVVRSVGARGAVNVPFKTISESAIAGEDFDDVQGVLEFEDGETEKNIIINIIDCEEYQKEKNFRIVLGRPELKKNELFEISGLTEEERKIALEGLPSLEDDCEQVKIRLTESRAFRRAVDKMKELAKENQESEYGPWAQQFADAVTVSAGDDDDDESEPGIFDYISHLVVLPWKVLFAFIPPVEYAGGSLCFVVSIAGIGVLTAFIGDFASHFGCTVGVTDAITAISFVALGTSVPDTFASKIAAINDDTADAAVGNVTGSNAVNVFLGIGLPWSAAAIYWVAQGYDGLQVKAGTLTFAVILFCIEAFIAICVLLVRRKFGGELGGPRPLKIASSMLFVCLWLFYLSMSTAKGYCKI